MSEVEVQNDEIIIKLTLEEAQILKTTIAQFNPDYAGPLVKLWHELEDAGVVQIENLFLVAKSNSPELRLYLEER